MKHVKLFEQFINEAKFEAKFGRLTDNNVEDKASRALTVLNKVIGKTITGADLKKIEGINFFGPNPGKNLKKTKLKFLDVHCGVYPSSNDLGFWLVYETKYDLNNQFVKDSTEDNSLLSAGEWLSNAEGGWNVDMPRSMGYSHIRPLRPQDASKVYTSTPDKMYYYLKLETTNTKKIAKALTVLNLGDIIL